MEKSDSIIIIPTYNEKENIENIIRAVFGLEKFFHHVHLLHGNNPAIYQVAQSHGERRTATAGIKLLAIDGPTDVYKRQCYSRRWFLRNDTPPLLSSHSHSWRTAPLFLSLIHI